MANLYKYRIWCSEENTYKFTWAESEPSVCPSNDTHSIDTTKTTIVEEVVDELPLSRHLQNKLAVHSSSKPEPAGHTTYAIWAGSGDDITADEDKSLGTGDLLSFNVNYDAGGAHTMTKDVKFDPRHGRVWIHEAYLKFADAGVADYLTSDVMAPATPLQQVANLNYYIEDGWLKYYTGGSPLPGSPPIELYGLAGNPILVERTFSQDGDWDYDGISLTPNFAGNGLYKITTIERSVHRYFNKIPLNGTSSTYFTMSSEETAELPVSLGYFLRIQVHNVSNSDWTLSVVMELYRERTVF